MGLILLKEYAAKNGKDPTVVRQKILRGGFKTAKKIGRDWFIDEDEPYSDGRMTSGKFVAWRKKTNAPMPVKGDAVVDDGEGNIVIHHGMWRFPVQYNRGYYHLRMIGADVDPIAAFNDPKGWEIVETGERFSDMQKAVRHMASIKRGKTMKARRKKSEG